MKGFVVDDRLKQNLFFLNKSDPELSRRILSSRIPESVETGIGKKGSPYLQVAGINFHSRYDPWKEASSFLNQPAARKAIAIGEQITIFGLGLGFSAFKAADMVQKVFVIEPNTWMIRLALSLLQFDSRLERIQFITDCSSYAQKSASPILFHGPSVRLNERDSDKWRRLLSEKESQLELTTENGDGILEAVQGINDVLSMLNEIKIKNIDELSNKVTERKGPLTEAENYILLLREFGAI